MIIFYIGFFFLALALVYHYSTRKYLNPYKLTFIFAKKGAGKSTLLTKLAIQHINNGWTVYSTERIPGCYLIDYKDIGFYEFPPRSCILIDEVGMIWDNRNFKSVSPEVRDWFKLQRHRKVKVYLASQSFDVDKKIRDLADEMFLLQKKFRVFSYGKRILKQLDIVEADGSQNSESRIVDQLKFDSLLFFWAGSRTLTFIPHWAPYFDSFTAPPLQEKEWTQLELPEELRKPRRRARHSLCVPKLPRLRK